MKIPLKEMGPQTDTIFLEYNWAIDLKTIFKNILLAFRKGWNQKLNDVSKAASFFFFFGFLTLFNRLSKHGKEKQTSSPNLVMVSYHSYSCRKRETFLVPFKRKDSGMALIGPA